MCMLDPTASTMQGDSADATSRQSPGIGIIPDLLVDLPPEPRLSLDLPSPEPRLRLRLDLPSPKPQGEWSDVHQRAACSCGGAECSADSGFSEPCERDLCPHCGLDCGGGCQDSPSVNLLQVPLSPVLNRSCSNEDSANCTACKSNNSSSPRCTWGENSPANQTSSAVDLEILAATKQRLANCDYYYGSISNTEARSKLRKKAHGTFLIRDSSHQLYLYAISTQTERGVTSVRVEYQNGTFRLDCEQAAEKYMPRFDCVLKLVDYYVNLSSDKVKNNCVWLESSGRRDTPVFLRTPLCKGIVSRQTELPKDVR